MSKLLKFIGRSLLGVLLLIGVLFIVLLTRKAVPEDYIEKVESNGIIETKYLQNGCYEVSSIEKGAMQSYKKYKIYYPSEIINSDNKYPVVIFSNGTGIKASSYPAVLKHLASWGFIVIATEEEYSWNGFSSEMCVKFLEKINNTKNIDGWNKNPFYNHIDFGNIGATGHSQGGIGVINAITNTEHKYIYKTAFIESPTNKELAKAIEWEYDATKINIPVVLISSTGKGDIDLVVSLEGLQAIYNDIPETTNKLMLRRNNANHEDMLYFSDGYMTAWFMWQLQGDIEASKAFLGDKPEIFNNNLYQDINKNF